MATNPLYDAFPLLRNSWTPLSGDTNSPSNDYEFMPNTPPSSFGFMSSTMPSYQPLAATSQPNFMTDIKPAYSMEGLGGNPAWLNASSQDFIPDTGKGGWFDTTGKGGMAIGAANTALGIFNSWMGAKNQKFLQNYYGKQQAMQMADFSNNAQETNRQISNQERSSMSMHGVDPNSQAGTDRLASHMTKWGVKTTV